VRRVSQSEPQNWNLDSIFPGGSQSDAFHIFLASLETDIARFQKRVDSAELSAELAEWVELLDTAQDVIARMRQAGAFVGCLLAQNMKDRAAQSLEGRVAQLSAARDTALTALDAKLLQMDDARFSDLLEADELARVQFSVEERRLRAKQKLSAEQENLISDLMVDGYHGWGQLYDTVVARMTVPYEADGQTTDLSMGQLANKLLDGNRDVRQALFPKWESAWANEADLCSSALNRIAGYRLATYKHRNWSSVLKEPLDINRMEPETLDVMWRVIEENKQPFVDFLNRKAKLIGVEKLSWHDVPAPLGSATEKLTYDEARTFIVDHFGKFSPDMAAFADMCFEKRWIEAEDRPGKRPGAFCTSFPVSKETRVFMTFSGTAANVSTLAHELGHAYHQQVMRDLPQFAQGYAMNVAETASTFAEMIVSDASVKNASSQKEKIALLEDKVQRSIAMFMNIHARFLFETRFYEERRKGLVSVDRLNELMVQAQTDAFKGALAEYHPHFWASKLHFYITGTPFYNFPYVFGFLFSSGVYARAVQEGSTFADKYVALLRDTASMKVEDLAQRHLGVNLTQPDFWQSAIDLSVKDAKEFVRLTN
jgi:oligoendopeptidase F